MEKIWISLVKLFHIINLFQPTTNLEMHFNQQLIITFLTVIYHKYTGIILKLLGDFQILKILT